MGLSSPNFYISPKKDGERFTDMHAYSSDKKGPIKKSWHFNINESGLKESSLGYPISEETGTEAGHDSHVNIEPYHLYHVNSVIDKLRQKYE